MKKIFNLLIILIIMVGLIAGFWLMWRLFNPVKLNEENMVVVIEPGDGVNQISQNLREQGVIKSSLAFEIYAYLKDVEHKFQAGQHKLPQILNMKRLVEILITGKEQDEWKLTIIEGWTAKDVGLKIESLGKLSSGEFLKAINNSPREYDFLKDKPVKADLEGYLFPDTYIFLARAKAEEIIGKMLDNFDRKLTRELREEIEKQDKTIFEIMIMASIIEKEVNTAEARPIVAGIFWKRLDIGMPLQADSTVNYVTGKNTPAVSSDDLQIESLYNTYKYPGLPPGPICNPGLAAIQAAIYPEESDYWFFLTEAGTDDAGKVHYAKTFEEHLSNKEKYLK